MTKVLFSSTILFSLHVAGASLPNVSCHPLSIMSLNSVYYTQICRIESKALPYVFFRLSGLIVFLTKLETSESHRSCVQLYPITFSCRVFQHGCSVLYCNMQYIQYCISTVEYHNNPAEAIV
ncbi:hypothetical protein BCR42DRAFT_398698 [Absidia repens]|uniref:Secreted protein n=1 Tax=Absidia repens TaxID=90262 RepID=A0A1X2HXE6_9FUNG|nr:hypothetical protein BCR42DRAFT_398698 [Absidia repens]